MSTFSQVVSLVCFGWSVVVSCLQAIGFIKLCRDYSKRPTRPVSPTLPNDHVPHITAIRPVKGVEAGLYECLASTFRQSYPSNKLTVCLCVASASDAAFPVLRQLVADFPDVDARILVEGDDPVLHGAEGHINRLGPNPKIRNISRAYREAKGDLIWIIDCNIWVAKGAAGRMVDRLCGFAPDGTRTTPYRLVHHLPLGVATDPDEQDGSQQDSSKVVPNRSRTGRIRGLYGSRLEEMFLSTSHAKFYNAINAVGIAPCVNGKSNMFRKSHLDRLTDPVQNPLLASHEMGRGRGIDFFSSYICEDHLIGDLLFRSNLPGYRRHGLVHGDLAIQPLSGMSAAAFVARRVRWLRVRKWTVLVATLVEPGVESLLCCLCFSLGLTAFPWFHDCLGIPPTWTALALTWLTAVTAWMLLDRRVYCKLHRCQSIEVDEDTPVFARGTSRVPGLSLQPFGAWLLAWLGREVLALPIWTWAVLLGTTVSWRGRSFRVHMDMSVVEMVDKSRPRTAGSSACRLVVNGARSKSKERTE